jgi:hypothetical protein
MKDFLNKVKDKASNLMTSGMDKARELTPDSTEIKRAADALVDSASKAATEVKQLGQEALKTDMAKDAAAGAAIGAVVAVPVPLIGPIAGAIVGAGLGVYKNIRQAPKGGANDAPPRLPPAQIIEAEIREVPSLDKYEELSKLHDLKVKGILTDDEFNTEKKKVLDR